MAHGLLVTGANGSYQIDSDTTQTEYLSVISSGTVNGTNNSRATITATAPDLVFMNKPDTGNNDTDGANGLLRNGYNTTNVTTKYIVARKTTSLTSYSGTYGLQVYNSANPSAKIFDSRGITEGIDILDIKAYGSMFGARMSGGNSSTPTPDTFTESNVDYPTRVYIGDTTDVYVSTLGASFQTYGSNYWMQYHFDYVNNEITLMSSSNYFGGGGLSHYKSWAPVYIGKLKT